MKIVTLWWSWFQPNWDILNCIISKTFSLKIENLRNHHLVRNFFNQPEKNGENHKPELFKMSICLFPTESVALDFWQQTIQDGLPLALGGKRFWHHLGTPLGSGWSFGDHVWSDPGFQSLFLLGTWDSTLRHRQRYRVPTAWRFVGLAAFISWEVAVQWNWDKCWIWKKFIAYTNAPMSGMTKLWT